MRKLVSSSRRCLLTMATVGLSWAGFATEAVALDPDKALGDYVFKTWTPEEGLPHRLVYAVLQTHDGYLWLATQDGLARFDGVRFTIFDTRNTPAIVESTIRGLAETKDGSLWVAALRSDLLRRRNGSIERLSDWLADLGLRSSDSSIFVDSRGTFWVASANGIARLGSDGRLRPVTTVDARSAPTWRKIAEDHAGRVWVTASDGARYVQGDAVVRVPATDGARAVYGSPDGRVWLGLDGGGLQQYRPDGLRPVPLPSKLPLTDLRVKVICGDRDGNLWVGTNDGLFRVQPDRGNAAVSAPIEASEVEDIIEDAQGNLWLATRAGLVQIKDPAFRTFTAAPGLQEALTLIEDREGTIWFVTRQSPYLQRVVHGRATPVAGVLPAGIQTVYQDRQGRMLLGTTAGLYRNDGGAWLRVPNTPRVSITTMVQDQQGALWLAETGGMVHRVGASGVTSYGTPEGLPPESVESFHCARDGSLWIATQAGAFKLRDGKVQAVKLVEKGQEPRVRYVGEDQDGAIWIGSRVGLTRIKEGATRAFGVQQGLPDPIVNAVVDDLHGNLWVACSKGVYRVAKSAFDRVVAGKAQDVTVLLYGRRDGIVAGQAWGTTAVRARDGSLWFATTRGVVSIPAARLAEREKPLPVFIEEAVINGQSYGTDASVSIKPGDGRLQFRFTALDFDAPERTQFRYRLEPEDPDWHYPDALR